MARPPQVRAGSNGGGGIRTHGPLARTPVSSKRFRPPNSAWVAEGPRPGRSRGKSRSVVIPPPAQSPSVQRGTDRADHAPVQARPAVPRHRGRVVEAARAQRLAEASILRCVDRRARRHPVLADPCVTARATAPRLPARAERPAVHDAEARSRQRHKHRRVFGHRLRQTLAIDPETPATADRQAPDSTPTERTPPRVRPSCGRRRVGPLLLMPRSDSDVRRTPRRRLRRSPHGVTPIRGREWPSASVAADSEQGAGHARQRGRGAQALIQDPFSSRRAGPPETLRTIVPRRSA